MKIAELVRILRSDDPSIRSEDVRHGLRLAERELRDEAGGPNTTALTLLVLLIGGVAFGVAFFYTQGGEVGVMPFLMASIFVLLLGLVALKARSRSG